MPITCECQSCLDVQQTTLIDICAQLPRSSVSTIVVAICRLVLDELRQLHTARSGHIRTKGVPADTNDVSISQLLEACFGAEDAALGLPLHNGSQGWKVVSTTIREIGPGVKLSFRVQSGLLTHRQVDTNPDPYIAVDVRYKECILSRCSVLLQSWFPAYSRDNCHFYASTQLALKNSVLRPNLPRVVPREYEDTYLGCVELLKHVLGSSSTTGACALYYLHHIQWVPYNVQYPGRDGHLIAHCTDGHGVWMVIVMRDIWLIKANKRRLAKLERQEKKRREQRKALVMHALRSVRELEQKFASDAWHGVGAGVAVFGAICSSPAEGLEIVAKVRGSQARLQEASIARALIPGLIIRQVDVDSASTSFSGYQRRQSRMLHHAAESSVNWSWIVAGAALTVTAAFVAYRSRSYWLPRVITGDS